MSDESEGVRLTEAERIEVDRRIDIANAVIPVARERFERKKELDDSLSSAIKRVDRRWVLVAAVAIGTINYLFPGKEFYSGIGFWLCMMAGLYWYIAVSDIEKLQSELSQCKQQLDSLCVTWMSAVGGEEGFWNIGSMNINDDVYRDWWFGWNKSVLIRVGAGE